MTFSFSPFKPGITLGIAMALFTSCERSNEQPNILWVTIEDTSPQFIRFYGNDQVKTPNMDRLAQEENAYLLLSMIIENMNATADHDNLNLQFRDQIPTL